VISASSAGIEVQAAIAQKIASGTAPSHHLLLDLKSPRIRHPAGPNQREIKPLLGCQTPNKWPAADDRDSQ
jgi:hypothetical protein